MSDSCVNTFNDLNHDNVNFETFSGISRQIIGSMALLITINNDDDLQERISGGQHEVVSSFEYYFSY